MSRKALFIGIDQYNNFPSLKCCVADANAMQLLLEKNENGSDNFAGDIYTSPSSQTITRRFLREKINELFAPDFNGDALFYFAGHGTASEYDGYLVTQDGEVGDYGIPMNELLDAANKSQANTVLLILDCCHSGHAGNPPNLQIISSKHSQLREGVTILAASKPTQESTEVNGHGVFTQLILGALDGGAADVRGRVSAASVYAYTEEALTNSGRQRPLYKSHAERLPPLRFCNPTVENSDLSLLPIIFKTPTTTVAMDPSFERTESEANPENIELFNKFKSFRNAGLLVTEYGNDLYYSALASEGVRLTKLGQFYWKLATDGIIKV